MPEVFGYTVRPAVGDVVTVVVGALCGGLFFAIGTGVVPLALLLESFYFFEEFVEGACGVDVFCWWHFVD